MNWCPRAPECGSLLPPGSLANCFKAPFGRIECAMAILIYSPASFLTVPIVSASSVLLSVR